MKEFSEQENKKITFDRLKRIGLYIKKERKKKNLSQEYLAFSVDTHSSLISKIERGMCKDITLNTLQKFSFFFDIDITKLLSL